MADMKDRIIYFQMGFITGIFITVAFAGLGYLIIKSLGGSGMGAAAKVARKINTIGEGQGKLKNFQLTFEQQADIRFFKTDGNIEVGQTQENATEGKSSLFVKVPDGHGGYPGLVWEAYHAQDCFNWNGKKELLFDVTNAGSESTHLILKLKSGVSGKQKKFEKWIPLAAGELTNGAIPINEMADKIDIAKISYMKFFLDKPKKGITLYIDNMHVKN